MELCNGSISDRVFSGTISFGTGSFYPIFAYHRAAPISTTSSNALCKSCTGSFSRFVPPGFSREIGISKPTLYSQLRVLSHHSLVVNCRFCTSIWLYDTVGESVGVEHSRCRGRNADLWGLEHPVKAATVLSSAGVRTVFRINRHFDTQGRWGWSTGCRKCLFGSAGGGFGIQIAD
jgi:hypothetical protein